MNQCFKNQFTDRHGQGIGSLVEPVGHQLSRITVDPAYTKKKIMT